MTIMNKCFIIILCLKCIIKVKGSNMLEELDLLINFLQTEYLEFNKKWMQSSYYERINFKDNKVCDLNNNELILNTIFNYREFINKNNIFLLLQLQSFESEKEKINTRVKLKNSIQYKIENYIKNHSNGEIPINKCLNDLFRNQNYFE